MGIGFCGKAQEGCVEGSRERHGVVYRGFCKEAHGGVGRGCCRETQTLAGGGGLVIGSLALGCILES